LELLAFNAQKFMRSRDSGHAPFYPLFPSGDGGRQDTSFELYTAIIGPQMISEKRFKSPIENALCGCQFGVKLSKIGDTLIGF